MGFFTDLFKKKPTNVFSETKRENGVVTYETEPQNILEVNGITITSGFVINKDEETASLHREATRLKDAGDWDGAVAALQKAQDRMRKSNFSHTTEGWLRLPLFLQQGGRFDESMDEFNRLLNEVDERMANEFSHQPKRFWLGFAHHPRSVIYDKMRVACKRQKLLVEADKYETLRDEFRDKGEKFKKKFDAWHSKDMERKRAELEKEYPSLARRKIDSSAK